MPSKPLTTRQQKAIAALLSARNVAEAAQLAGVGERTLHTWLTQPEFRAAVRHAEGDMLDGAARRLLNLQDSAIDTLTEILTSGRASDRRLAAQAVLDYLLKLRELRNLDDRLTALEAAIHAKDNR